jgi:hypothetical protein
MACGTLTTAKVSAAIRSDGVAALGFRLAPRPELFPRWLRHRGRTQWITGLRRDWLMIHQRATRDQPAQN